MSVLSVALVSMWCWVADRAFVGTPAALVSQCLHCKQLLTSLLSLVPHLYLIDRSSRASARYMRASTTQRVCLPVVVFCSEIRGLLWIASMHVFIYY
jgi:hypothetical protein